MGCAINTIKAQINPKNIKMLAQSQSLKSMEDNRKF